MLAIGESSCMWRGRVACPSGSAPLRAGRLVIAGICENVAAGGRGSVRAGKGDCGSAGASPSQNLGQRSSGGRGSVRAGKGDCGSAGASPSQNLGRRSSGGRGSVRAGVRRGAPGGSSSRQCAKTLSEEYPCAGGQCGDHQ